MPFEGLLPGAKSANAAGAGSGSELEAPPSSTFLGRGTPAFGASTSGGNRSGLDSAASFGRPALGLKLVLDAETDEIAGSISGSIGSNGVGKNFNSGGNAGGGNGNAGGKRGLGVGSQSGSSGVVDAGSITSKSATFADDVMQIQKDQNSSSNPPNNDSRNTDPLPNPDSDLPATSKTPESPTHRGILVNLLNEREDSLSRAGSAMSRTGSALSRREEANVESQGNSNDPSTTNPDNGQAEEARGDSNAKRGSKSKSKTGKLNHPQLYGKPLKHEFRMLQQLGVEVGKPGVTVKKGNSEGGDTNHSTESTSNTSSDFKSVIEVSKAKNRALFNCLKALGYESESVYFEQTKGTIANAGETVKVKRDEVIQVRIESR
jgi:hypothetical protein